MTSNLTPTHGADAATEAQNGVAELRTTLEERGAAKQYHGAVKVGKRADVVALLLERLLAIQPDTAALRLGTQWLPDAGAGTPEGFFVACVTLVFDEAVIDVKVTVDPTVAKPYALVEFRVAPSKDDNDPYGHGWYSLMEAIVSDLTWGANKAKLDRFWTVSQTYWVD